LPPTLSKQGSIFWHASQALPIAAKQLQEAAIKAPQDELARSLQFAQKERIAALEHLVKERGPALKELHEDMVVERLALPQDHVNRDPDHSLRSGAASRATAFSARRQFSGSKSSERQLAFSHTI
jgi:hypothetical protein